MSSSPRARHPRLLLVDAGNSRTKLGLFDAPATVENELPDCAQELVFANDAAIPWERIAADHALAAADHSAWALCLTGSNPSRVSELRSSLPGDWPTPRELPPRSELSLTIDVDFPEQVGIDRLLNGVAANRLRRPGQAAVIVSSGTATTVDYLDPAGRYRGGAILPGFELAARSLHEYTALLPLIPLEPVLNSPPEPIGRNTADAIRGGLYWGHIGAVRELLRQGLHRGTQEQNAGDSADERHLGNASASETPLVVVTGGAAPLLLPHLPGFCEHHPYLPLQGLALTVWGLPQRPAA